MVYMCVLVYTCVCVSVCVKSESVRGKTPARESTRESVRVRARKRETILIKRKTM